MRLTSDRAKQALLHPEQHVRNAAAYYFSRSFNQDRGVLPLVIEAIEKHGDSDAFSLYSFLQNLVHTDESFLWVIGRLKKTDAPKLDEDYVGGLARGLISSFVHAAPALLRPQQDLIDNLTCLDDRDRSIAFDRLRMSSAEPSTLWDELEAFCEEHKGEDDLTKAIMNYGTCLAEAIGRHQPVFGERILKLLDVKIDDYRNNPMAWMEPLAVEIAGEMRLEPAVPAIVNKLNQDFIWLDEECLWALTKIGTDSVVETMVSNYKGAEFGFRLSTAAILEDIHSDLAVKTSFDLLEIEDDETLRTYLHRALLINGATEVFESVRQQLLAAEEHDPEWREVRSDLVTAATIMAVDFPELADWKEDLKHDMEARKQWYADNVPIYDEDESDDGEELHFDDGDDEWLPPPTTIVSGEKVGRNELCPCESGKKFKKCCMRKNESLLN